MSSAESFAKTLIAGTEVNVFPLDTISLTRIEDGNFDERMRLLNASARSGFFYLDLSDTELESIFTDEECLYQLSKRYFDQPHGTKIKDRREDRDSGYQFCPTDETFELARDEFRDGSFALPAILDAEENLLARFSSACDTVVQKLLHHFSEILGTDLSKYHQVAKPSDTGLKLVYEPTKTKVTDVLENKHTDSGTITLLFGQEWGMHLQDPESGQWAFIEPKRRTILVNVADTLQRLSGGKLHSGLHRVTQPVDGAGERYYLTYFLRPQKE